MPDERLQLARRNGSQHPSPCSVCLRKLLWNLKFDVRERYRQLRAIYQRSGYDDLALWMDRRLAKLEVTEHNP